jgi:hypothetical protein
MTTRILERRCKVCGRAGTMTLKSPSTTAAAYNGPLAAIWIERCR